MDSPSAIGLSPPGFSEKAVQKAERKRRTREHIIADLSINHVERCVLRCGWTVQRFNPDYGLDLLITTFTRSGEIENGDIRVQVKAMGSAKKASAQGYLAIRLDHRDVIYWLNEPLPVILVVYDAHSDLAWWVHVQAALRFERSSTSARVAGSLVIRVPLSNVLNIVAVRRFRKLRDIALTGSRG